MAAKAEAHAPQPQGRMGLLEPIDGRLNIREELRSRHLIAMLTADGLAGFVVTHLQIGSRAREGAQR